MTAFGSRSLLRPQQSWPAKVNGCRLMSPDVALVIFRPSLCNKMHIRKMSHVAHVARTPATMLGSKFFHV